MKVLENLKYTNDHEWIRIDGNIAYIGITDFAQSELGDIVFVEINNIGETLSKEEALGTIEAVKTVSDVFMPISGEILELNPEVESDPSVINKDPYDAGWIVKIKIQDATELDNLLTATQYKKLIGA